MLIFTIKYVNDIKSIKMFNRDKFIYCKKNFDYVPSNQLIYFKNKNTISLTDDGLKYLLNLTYLKLGHNKNITDNGLKYLPKLETYNYRRHILK